jgi:short subunit dehydrogenase
MLGSKIVETVASERACTGRFLGLNGWSGLDAMNANSKNLKEASLEKAPREARTKGQGRMQGNRRDDWVMVTGATGGIGKVLVARLIATGQNVIAAVREPSRMSVAPGIGRVVTVQLDMAQPSTITQAAQEVMRTAGNNGLSGLVNMAGIIVEGRLRPFLRLGCDANSTLMWSVRSRSRKRCRRCSNKRAAGS